jgi:hypothetical protein
MKHTSNKWMVYAFFLVVLGLAISCLAPENKETYLTRFSQFVNRVKEDHSKYTASDWEYADKRFRKFSEEWHDRFDEELTASEELKVAALILQYNMYKGKDKLENIYRKELKEDVDELKEQIEYYMENDMEEDLERLKQGAREIGDSALRVVEEIIESIGN